MIDGSYSESNESPMSSKSSIGVDPSLQFITSLQEINEK